MHTNPDSEATVPGFDPMLFRLPAPLLAPRLLGVTLIVDGVGGLITETEAYDATDPASHSFKGPTARNGAMFGPVGHAYVYRIYGIHWCLNVVCGESGSGQAVLIRALEPRLGIDAMVARRGLGDARALCSGPGKLCQALNVGPAHNGLDLTARPFDLRDRREAGGVLVGPRIGITKGAETPWRFGLRGSRHLSRPFPHP